MKTAFKSELISLALADIVPTKAISVTDRRSETYRRVAISVPHVGVIEPLVVFPAGNRKYLLLDGHIRLDVLQRSGATVTICLVATDNEAYTYNKRVNSIPPIAQHHMILRALKYVREERIAAALGISVASVREKRDLLKGICPEATEILRTERIGAAAFASLRKMKPVRQIEVARLMINTHKFSGKFARILLEGTRDEMLQPQFVARSRTAAPADQSMMERETDSLLKHVEHVKATYGEEVLDLSAACRYLERLLANGRILRYLSKNHSDTLGEIKQILGDVSADRGRQHTTARLSEPNQNKGIQPARAS